MEDKIILDRETFKVLAIDTRVNILKKLDERFQLTLTDLANELNMAPSTISEHLDKLVSAGLIRQVDRGMKWKYYRLTPKGKGILNPYEKRVWIILTVSTLALFVAVYHLLLRLSQLAGTPLANLIAGEGRDVGGAPRMLEAEKVMEYNVVSKTSQIPYSELMIVLLLVLVTGICVGYLIRKKRIL